MSTESKRDDRPKKKKKKKQSSGAPWLLIGSAGGVLLLLLIVGVGLIVWKPWARAEQPQPVAQNPPMPPPPPVVPNNNPGGVVKEPKTLLGNIRARAQDTARDNEMRQIHLFYEQYCQIAGNSRTVDGFLNSFKRDSNKIYNDFKTEKSYTANVKARPGSEDIVAYETERYTLGYYVVRANGQLGFVSPEDLKAAVP